MKSSFHLAADDRIAARVVHHPAHTVAGYAYRARTLAHVDLGDMSLVLDADQARVLRDALTTALDERQADAHDEREGSR